MRFFHGIKLGGLQQKIFNLLLIFMALLIVVSVVSSVYQRNSLDKIVNEANDKQQSAITGISQSTLEAVLNSTMYKSTAFQAYIANDMFGELRTDVLTMQAIAEDLFERAESLSDISAYAPDSERNGTASIRIQHEEGVDPDASEKLGIVANMSEIMLAMFENSDKLSSCYVATADGCFVLVEKTSDLSGVTSDIFNVRDRFWYKQAVEAGETVFSGVEIDAFSGNLEIDCAAPVYSDGELCAVVGASIFLNSIGDYVKNTETLGGVICVVNENGQVLFSSADEGTFKAELSANAKDLRESGETELAKFITDALTERTDVTKITIDGKEYYAAGAPMPTIGWTVVSVIEKDITLQTAYEMTRQFEDIKTSAFAEYNDNAGRIQTIVIIIIIGVVILATVGALLLAKRIVKPIERMTQRINEISESDAAFHMEKMYETGDEIEILAQSFETLSERTRNYITQITQITAEKERIGTELALATRIQADMLPNIYPAFPDRPDFDIYATMTPAKEVGGDFYDFFLIDDDHLGLVMADVSGKGVPAALFMMISKILVQNYAMTGLSPKNVLEAVNEQICSNNREEMFVTVWFGILDLTSGKLTAANAGHEYPILKKADGSFEIVKDKHGFVIGGMAGVKYKEYELQMDPGAKLFLYTDGVPEATNAESELFGIDRTLAALNSDSDGTTVEILGAVNSAVHAFVGDAPQFDDLTMLCLYYIGKEGQNAKEITVDAKVENIEAVTDFVNAELEAHECGMKAQMQIDVAVDEIVCNIAKYAYDGKEGKLTVGVEIKDGTAFLTFTDSGKPYDPTEKEDPDTTLSAEDREIGGLGVFIVKKTMDDVKYEYKKGKNVLRINKRI